MAAQGNSKTNPTKKVKIYEYAQCSTCRKALQFLDRNQIPYDRVSITDTPPSVAELKKMLQFLQEKGRQEDGQPVDLRKLFNTSGQLYREWKISEKLPKMSATEALELLAQNGKLIKRPFLLTERSGLLGFKESEWEQTLV